MAQQKPLKRFAFALNVAFHRAEATVPMKSLRVSSGLLIIETNILCGL
jgi:hypothetical protein